MLPILVLGCAALVDGQPAATGNGTPPVRATGGWTQFFGSAVAGDGDDEVKVGGKLNGTVVIDGGTLKLWRGVSVNVNAEFVFGSSVNGSDIGTVLPLNTAMLFPASGDEDFDLSIFMTQQLGNSTLSVGKINMLESAARTPLISGGGLEGFHSVALGATPSELTPPTLFGALWTYTAPRAVLTLGGWDVTSALNRTGLSSPFSEGIAGMVSVMLPRTWRAQRGFHTFTLLLNTKRGLNLEDIGNLLLPPESEAVVGAKRGAWHVKYAVQQYLWSDPKDPSRGWGLFGHVGLWDANPTAMQWSMTAGIAGSPPMAARPADRFGFGYFRSSLSDTLREGLQPIVTLEAEQGVEGFYTFEVIRHLRVTGAVQWVNPSVRGVDDAVVLALRTRVSF